MVIDDNPTTLELLSELVSELDCDVRTAMTARAGIAAARSERPALILMDVQLPRMDGYEATMRLKRHPVTGGIPVVAITCHAMRGEEARARAAGCDAFLAKPFREEEFFATVRRFLEQGDFAWPAPAMRAKGER